MQTYLKANAIKENYNETNDCSVKAVAITCNVPYKVAHQALKLQGRKDRQGCSFWQIKEAVYKLGFWVEVVDTKRNVATVAGLERCPELKKGFFFVCTKGHIVSVVNGTVQDWTAEHGRREKLMTEVYRITPLGTRKERKAKAKALFA